MRPTWPVDAAQCRVVQPACEGEAQGRQPLEVGDGVKGSRLEAAVGGLWGKQ
jgi:hypothetical protein